MTPATGAPAVVVVLHGYEGNEPDHWQTWLAGQLSAHGVAVRYPDLPDPHAPNLGAWTATLGAVLSRDSASGRVVVAHSLACHLWAAYARSVTVPTAERVLLVAPPGVPETTATFHGFDPLLLVDGAAVRAAGPAELVLATDDPWCVDPAAYAEGWGPEAVTWLTGAGHINVASGFGPWPWALDWALGV